MHNKNRSQIIKYYMKTLSAIVSVLFVVDCGLLVSESLSVKLRFRNVYIYKKKER